MADVQLKKLSPVEVTLKVTINPTQLSERLDARIKSTGARMRLKGFRPGKVSPHAVSQRFNYSISMDVYQDLANEVLLQELQTRDLRPLLSPRVDDLKHPQEGALTFTAQVEVAPKIRFNGLNKLPIARYIPALDDADLAEALEQLRLANPVWETVDRAADNGDKVLCDFTGRLKGKPFRGGDASDVAVHLGSGTMIEGFESALTGAVAGETREFKATFPSEYGNKKLAGHTVSFKANIKQVSAPQEATLDDAFAERLASEEGGKSQTATLESLTHDIRKQLQDRLEMLCSRHTFDVAVEMLIAKYAFTLPPQLLQRQQEAVQRQNPQMPQEECTALAEKVIYRELLIDALSGAFDLKADAEAVELEIKREAESWGRDPQQAIQAYYNNKRLLQQVQARVQDRNVIDFLIEQTKKLREQPLSYAQARDFQEHRDLNDSKRSNQWRLPWKKT